MNDIRKMDLNLLVVFEHLLQEHNVTAAAARLGLSQAAVSASLKRLRALYGDPLFLRTQNGLRPTPRAIVLKPMVEDALSIVRKSLDLSGDPAADSQTHVVTLGLSDDFEMAFGRALIQAAERLLPGVRLVFRQTNSAMVAAALHDRQIDLAITSGGVSDSRLKHLSLGSSGYLCVYDLKRRGSHAPLAIEEYIAREHLLISFSGLVGVVDDVLAEHGLRRRLRAATSHFSALPFLLAETDAIATLPGHAARALLPLRIFGVSPCPIAFPSYSIDLSWRFDAVRQRPIQQMRDLIAEFFSRELTA
ncbi:DNA-binding transcriptional LysR family regulator [Microvirga flocculans]|uniref:DNA-binding transcriptional LysR family regulator n=1 Tax=Microvirga flocculans TaxID=217168 RepID=A0A7W6N711_9HYPH|nr:LysR substrate-binding domain-containing protein [Microvirga flocculans]MBB4038838.1 DNA-binding transcriptional LysR family regulator [Microvirga flocculans]